MTLMKAIRLSLLVSFLKEAFVIAFMHLRGRDYNFEIFPFVVFFAFFVLALLAFRPVGNRIGSDS